jgi:DNA repair exonuclease SbcCD ATPase subunit
MSFSDMMSSGRGPGVIGMGMALVVLLGFGVLFMFAFDEGFQGGEQSDEAVIASQGKEIANYQLSIDAGQKSLEKGPKLVSDTKELNSLNVENQTTQQNIVSLNEKVTAAQSALAELGNDFEGYKDEYRAYVRSKAKGTVIAELVTVKGEVYKQARISEVTAIGMQVVHLEGQKRIPLEDLPDDMKDYYQFDPNQKEKAAEIEKKTRDEHEKLVGESEKIADAAAAQQKLVDAEKAKARAKEQIALKKTELSNYKSRAKELQNMIQQEERKRGGLKKTGQYKEKLGEIQSTMAEIQAQIDKLSVSL